MNINKIYGLLVAPAPLLLLKFAQVCIHYITDTFNAYCDKIYSAASSTQVVPVPGDDDSISAVKVEVLAADPDT
jgi:hypothetical protein